MGRGCPRPFTRAFKQNKDVYIDPLTGEDVLSQGCKPSPACEGSVLPSKDASGAQGCSPAAVQRVRGPTCLSFGQSTPAPDTAETGGEAGQAQGERCSRKCRWSWASHLPSWVQFAGGASCNFEIALDLIARRTGPRSVIRPLWRVALHQEPQLSEPDQLKS